MQLKKQKSWKTARQQYDICHHKTSQGSIGGRKDLYKKSKKIYEDYWTSYEDSYVGGVEKTYQILIDQLEALPEYLNA